ncbi:MAG: histidine phosphatase family protein [Dehalococcoidia bacterium]|nr:histidine phosphatase family protein [Dehalococcoidia bacterium]
MVRLTILCHGPVESLARGGFPLEDDGIASSTGHLRAGLVLPSFEHVLCAPERRTRETATVFGLAAEVTEALRDTDYGRWAGRSLSEVAAVDGKLLAAWTADAAVAPPGGEPFAEVVARVGAWMEDLAANSHPILAISHPSVIRAALGHALKLDPPGLAYGFDVQPLSAVSFTHDGRRWKARL